MKIIRTSYSRQSGITVYMASGLTETCYVVNLWRDRAGSSVTKFSMKKGSDRSDRPVDRSVAEYCMQVALSTLMGDAPRSEVA